MMHPDHNDGSLVSGVYAALVTPVDETGRPDGAALRSVIDFVVSKGVDGVCIGGGTAEYPHFGLDQRKEIVSSAVRHLNGRLPFLVSIGAPTARGVLELGEHAVAQGCQALLLPMPYFYRYEQQDLAAYVREVARALAAPCLLYNLAAFTNPLEPETALDLLRSEAHVVGLKDSSGNRAALRALSEGRSAEEWSFLCGSDGLAYDALEAGWNGFVSGIACCCPELLVALHGHYRAGRMDEAERCQRLLDALVEAAEWLPAPWTIRVAAEIRGFSTGPFSLPLAPGRRSEMARLRTFLEEWFDEHLPSLS